MYRRSHVIVALVLLTGGLVSLGLALVHASMPLRASLIGVVLVLTAVCALFAIQTNRAAVEHSPAALTAARTEGYRLAVRHFAQGVFEPNALDDPTPPHGLDVSNVRQLHAASTTERAPRREFQHRQQSG